MKIFVINLLRDSERRANATRQLSAQNITFEFFPAIEVKNGRVDWFDHYDEQQFLINTGRKVTSGEIGCYASHKALWSKCIELDEPIMIMEDDFLLDNLFADAVKTVESCIAEFRYIRLQSETRARKLPIRDYDRFTLYRYTKIPHSAMCYAITPDVAQAFLDQSIALVEPIDVMVKKAWQHNQPLYGLAPYTVTESRLSTDSCIGDRPKDSKPLRIRLLRLITRIGWGFRLHRYNQQMNKSATS